MIALGVDPSLSCTGWAVVSDEEAGDWRLLAGGAIRADVEESLWKRCRAVCEELEGDVGDLRRVLSVIAVEMPQTRMFRGVRRSNATLPAYGVCVGAVAALLETWRRGFNPEIDTLPLWTPSATEWAMGLATRSSTDRKRGVPQGRKPHRIREAQLLFGPITLRVASAAATEAVADAALLARWAILRERLIEATNADGGGP